HFAVVRAPAGLHVEKVVVEATIPGCVRPRAVGALRKESQRYKREPNGGGARHQPALDGNRIARQSQTDGRNAGGPVVFGLVQDHAVGRVGLVLEVAEGLLLERVEQDRFGSRRVGVGHFALPSMTCTVCVLPSSTRAIPSPASAGAPSIWSSATPRETPCGFS